MHLARSLLAVGIAAVGVLSVYGVYRGIRARRDAVNRPPVDDAGEHRLDTTTTSCNDSSDVSDTTNVDSRVQRAARIVVRPLTTQTQVFLELLLLVVAVLLVLLANVNDFMMFVSALLVWLALRITATTAPLSAGFDVLDYEVASPKHDHQQRVLEQDDENACEHTEADNNVSHDQYAGSSIERFAESNDPSHFLGRIPCSQDIECIENIDITLDDCLWQDACTLFYQLYGSHQRPDIIVASDKFISSPLIPDNIIMRRRQNFTSIQVPFLLRSLVRGIDRIEADERSVMDTNARTLQIHSRNVTGRDILMVFEVLNIRPHPTITTATLITRRMYFRIEFSSSLRATLAHAVRYGLRKSATKTNQALTQLLITKRSPLNSQR